MIASAHWTKQLRILRQFLSTPHTDEEKVKFAKTVMAFDPKHKTPAWNQHSFNTIIHYLGNGTIHHKIKTVLEIGGGYGELAKMFKIAFPDIKYVIVDFPECLELAKAYFELNNMDNTIELCDVDKFVPGEIFDLIISKASLQEMAKEAINLWMHYIENHCRYFYSLNYLKPSKYYRETEGIAPLKLNFDNWMILDKIENPQTILDFSHGKREWLEILLKRRLK